MGGLGLVRERERGREAGDVERGGLERELVQTPLITQGGELKAHAREQLRGAPNGEQPLRPKELQRGEAGREWLQNEDGALARLEQWRQCRIHCLHGARREWRVVDGDRELHREHQLLSLMQLLERRHGRGRAAASDDDAAERGAQGGREQQSLRRGAQLGGGAVGAMLLHEPQPLRWALLPQIERRSDREDRLLHLAQPAPRELRRAELVRVPCKIGPEQGAR